MEPSKPIESYGNIYKALDSENAQQALKQLNQKDRAIVLIALGNFRLRAAPDKMKQILPGETTRVVKLLKDSQVKHARSGFLDRLFKGIQNLFGRISSSNLLNNFRDIKEKIETQLPNKRNEFSKLKKEIEELKNKSKATAGALEVLDDIIKMAAGSRGKTSEKFDQSPFGILHRVYRSPQNKSFNNLPSDLSEEDINAVISILFDKQFDEELAKTQELPEPLRYKSQVDYVNEKIKKLEALQSADSNEVTNKNKSVERLNIEINKLIDLESAINPPDQ